MRNSNAAIPVLALRNISKVFGGAHALNSVDLTVYPGQVHGLLGENGSGKSTLIKVLAGFHAPEPGAEMEFNGRQVDLPLHPGEFRALGISFVHQDLALVPSLTVVENLRIGELASRGRWHISWASERRRAAEIFRRYGVAIDPAADVADLSVVDRALLAIVRAVEDMRATTGVVGGERAGLLVLDEATATLPKEGVEHLFSLVRGIAATGSSILLVSHFLNEILEITDEVTVLRDGRVAGTATTRETSESHLVEMIIGRRLEKLGLTGAGRTETQDKVTIQNLTGGAAREVSFDVGVGEVLGATGLLGSGFEDLPYLLFGARKPDAGALIMAGQEYDLCSLKPATAIALGVALLPADRLNDGSIPSLSVLDNISMQVLDEQSTFKSLNRGLMRRKARSIMGEFDVRPLEPRATFESLSGGNQQKVVLAKWIQTRPKLLLLHEPTVGVDVGARQQIYRLIRDAARAGTSVVCCSSDFEQLADLCDRVLIFGNGRVVRELSGPDVTEERIAEQSLISMSAVQSLTTFMEAEGAG